MVYQDVRNYEDAPRNIPILSSKPEDNGRQFVIPDDLFLSNAARVKEQYFGGTEGPWSPDPPPPPLPPPFPRRLATKKEPPDPYDRIVRIVNALRGLRWADFAKEAEVTPELKEQLAAMGEAYREITGEDLEEKGLPVPRGDVPPIPPRFTDTDAKDLVKEIALDIVRQTEESGYDVPDLAQMEEEVLNILFKDFTWRDYNLIEVDFDDPDARLHRVTCLAYVPDSILANAMDLISDVADSDARYLLFDERLGLGINNAVLKGLMPKEVMGFIKTAAANPDDWMALLGRHFGDNAADVDKKIMDWVTEFKANWPETARALVEQGNIDKKLTNWDIGFPHLIDNTPDSAYENNTAGAPEYGKTRQIAIAEDRKERFLGSGWDTEKTIAQNVKAAMSRNPNLNPEQKTMETPEGRRVALPDNERAARGEEQNEIIRALEDISQQSGLLPTSLELAQLLFDGFQPYLDGFANKVAVRRQAILTGQLQTPKARKDYLKKYDINLDDLTKEAAAGIDKSFLAHLNKGDQPEPFINYFHDVPTAAEQQEDLDAQPMSIYDILVQDRIDADAEEKLQKTLQSELETLISNALTRRGETINAEERGVLINKLFGVKTIEEAHTILMAPDPASGLTLLDVAVQNTVETKAITDRLALTEDHTKATKAVEQWMNNPITNPSRIRFNELSLNQQDELASKLWAYTSKFDPKEMPLSVDAFMSSITTYELSNQSALPYMAALTASHDLFKNIGDVRTYFKQFMESFTDETGARLYDTSPEAMKAYQGPIEDMWEAFNKAVQRETLFNAEEEIRNITRIDAPPSVDPVSEFPPRKPVDQRGPVITPDDIWIPGKGFEPESELPPIAHRDGITIVPTVAPLDPSTITAAPEYQSLFRATEAAAKKAEEEAGWDRAVSTTTGREQMVLAFLRENNYPIDDINALAARPEMLAALGRRFTFASFEDALADQDFMATVNRYILGIAGDVEAAKRELEFAKAREAIDTEPEIRSLIYQEALERGIIGPDTPQDFLVNFTQKVVPKILQNVMLRPDRPANANEMMTLIGQSFEAMPATDIDLSMFRQVNPRIFGRQEMPPQFVQEPMPGFDMAEVRPFLEETALDRPEFAQFVGDELPALQERFIEAQRPTLDVEGVVGTLGGPLGSFAQQLEEKRAELAELAELMSSSRESIYAEQIGGIPYATILSATESAKTKLEAQIANLESMLSRPSGLTSAVKSSFRRPGFSGTQQEFLEQRRPELEYRFGRERPLLLQQEERRLAFDEETKRADIEHKAAVAESDRRQLLRGRGRTRVLTRPGV